MPSSASRVTKVEHNWTNQNIMAQQNKTILSCFAFPERSLRMFKIGIAICHDESGEEQRLPANYEIFSTSCSCPLTNAPILFPLLAQFLHYFATVMIISKSIN
jgi:hypothetical protein